MNLQDKKNELPFILDPVTNLRVLIDTGSTRSFVRKFIGSQCFKDSLLEDDFEVTTAHGTTKEKFSCKIPLLSKEKNKFYLFDFHKDFDLLLGLDNLRKLKINLDFVNNKLIFNNNKIITIRYFNTELESNNSKEELAEGTPVNRNRISSYVIRSRTCNTIKVNVTGIENGDAVMPYNNLSGLEIPQSIVKVNNGTALCHIINPLLCTKKLTLKEPFKLDSLDNYHCCPTNNSENGNNKINFNLLNHEIQNLDLSKIRTEHMNSEEKTTILNLVKEYEDIFHIEGNNLTFTDQIKHVIRTTDEIPVYTRNYRYPEIYKEEVDKQIKGMLSQKIIQPSRSPWNSPIWIVPKKRDASGKEKFRLVIDFRGLNSKTIDDKFPLPNITDILDKLGRAQYFSTLDLASGFHQVEMHPDSVEKTAFSTETGHYEFLRMPFGLKNSPPTFQRVMNNMLRGIQNEKCLVYLDDIIIYSTSLTEHVIRLREVFERLRKANFKIQLDKTEFLRKEVAYLGHVVTSEGVKPNPDKVRAIKKYPIPKTTKEIKGFLGLLGYYRKFIKDFAELTKPLTKCLKKGAKIDVTKPEYIDCFETCKNILSNEPLLQYPDFEREFNLTTDASNIALGAVLSQVKNGADLPIAYASRTLSESEGRLSTIEKELLAIVWATKYFRPYLYGRKFKIFTDHRPLQWLFSIKEPNAKLLRWRLKLEEYDYQIIYKKGKMNLNADALSRIQLLNMDNTRSDNTENSSDQDISKLISEAASLYFPELDDSQSMIANRDISENLIDDLMDEMVREQLDDLEGEQDSGQTQHSNYEGNTTVNIPISEEPVNLGKNQVILSLVKYNPKKIKIQKLFDNSKTRLIVEISETNMDNDIVNFVKEYLLPNIKYNIYFENDFYERFAATIAKYFKSSQLQLVKCTKKLLDIGSDEEVEEIINNYHSGKNNHRGIQETYEQIKRRYYFPNLKSHIQNFVNKCEVCLKTKYERTPLNLELNLTPTATRPLQTIHIDSFTLEKQKFLTIIDTFSRYAQAYKIAGAQAIEIVNKLLIYFSHHGIPEVIVSDNGTEFNNSLVKDLMKIHKIKIRFISTQHPQSNGIAERLHSTLIEHIRLLNNQSEFKNESVENKLKYAIIAYNNSIHSVTKLTPFEILYGHINTNTLLDIDLDKQVANDYIFNHTQKTQKLYEHVREVNQLTKENVQNRRNIDREPLPEIPPEVYVKNMQKQSKTKNKYNKETISSINERLKTAKIKARHHNTKEKIHLTKIKRPRKFKTVRKLPQLKPTDNPVNPVPGPSCSSKEPQPK